LLHMAGSQFIELNMADMGHDVEAT
jgi:hypothetical protein